MAATFGSYFDNHIIILMDSLLVAHRTFIFSVLGCMPFSFLYRLL